MSLGALSIRTDKANYRIGETPTYIITGGDPGGSIAWTSNLDGVGTGEYQAQYGQFLDANGNATLVAGGPWTNDYIGYWKKEILVTDPTDNSQDVARVNFSVSSDGSPISAPSVVQPGEIGSGLFDGDYTLPVIGSVPKIAALAGVGLLLFYLTNKK